MWTGMLTLSLAMNGCASHNYDFTSITIESSRITQLVDGLDMAIGEEEERAEELYDISIVPLVHSRLHVFAQADGEDAPAEFIEADIDSYLPFFGFVNGTVSQYDIDKQLITRHNFDSSLWGAFRKERELVVTRSGNREKTRHTFLWLLSWWGEEKWHPADDVALGNDVEP